MSPIRKPATPGSRVNGPGQRVSRGLVALSSAAVLAVYSAGYLRTQAAADRFESEAGQRRPVVPAPTTAVTGAPQERVPATVATPASPPAVGPGLLPAASTLAARPASAVAAPAAPTIAKPAHPAVPTPPAAPAASVSEPSALGSQTAPDATTATEAAPLVTAVATTAGPVSPTTPPVPAAPRYKDGTFTGWGTSRHGDIEAQVIIANGRITSATISQCWTRWPCSWVAALPGQVVARQSPETDFVSGATQSTNAFYYAVVQALGKASLP